MAQKLQLALHIGAHKTASTYLQQALKAQRKMLLDEGICYLGPNHMRKPGNALHQMFALTPQANPPRSGTEQLAFLANGKRKLLISEENIPGSLSHDGKIPLPLYPGSVDKLTAFAKAIAPQTFDLFLAIRQPDSFISSAYSQSLLSEGPFLSPQTYCQMNDWRNVDWHRYVQRLSLLPGLDTLFVWRYEDTADVLRLVLRRMLRWKVGGNVELPEKRSHRGLSQKALLRVLEWTEEGRTGKLGHEARSAHPVTDTNPPFRLFSPDQVAAAAAAYQQQLDRIETTDKVKLLHPPKATAQG